MLAGLNESQQRVGRPEEERRERDQPQLIEHWSILSRLPQWAQLRLHAGVCHDPKKGLDEGGGEIATLRRMCRNIRTLHNFEPPATEEEIRDAALQYVRKISGYSKPSHANQAAFEQAVVEVARATQKLLDHLVTGAPPRDRTVVAARARERAAARFGTA